MPQRGASADGDSCREEPLQRCQERREQRTLASSARPAKKCVCEVLLFFFAVSEGALVGILLTYGVVMHKCKTLHCKVSCSQESEGAATEIGRQFNYQSWKARVLTT